MNYDQFVVLSLSIIKQYGFDEGTMKLEDSIFNMSREDIMSIVPYLGIIPEFIEPDSAEEKAYTKSTEIMLSKCFQELGLKSEPIKTRSKCADVIAKSKYHNYSLVADAKAFRLSRTAKNQKDFKVEAMDTWRGSADYAVLVCPYYQYPKRQSQVYSQALDKNVSMFSWELIHILLQNKIKETPKNNLSFIWEISSVLAKDITVSTKENRFLELQNEKLSLFFGQKKDLINNLIENYKTIIVDRGEIEVSYLNGKIESIKKMTRQQAIDELIRVSNLDQKIVAIKKYTSSL